ncbi:hypothetical protein KY359_05235, partial [Candidatus Woesearchaeota archaeon]|nr:hypothetical protein [Candidatus Woesearchaeota archaeon]
MEDENKARGGTTEHYEEREAQAVADGRRNMSSVFSSRRAGRGGLFAELRENNAVYPEHYMVLTNDGAGTKITLCPWMERFSTIGQDVVAMNANDFAPFGLAYPDAVNLYFAVQSKIEEEKMGEIMKGIDAALQQCIREGIPFSLNYGKLETASLEEMLDSTHPGLGFDIACSMTGFIRKDDVPSFDPIPGDIIVGLASTGLHSNGYTAARHILLKPGIEPRERWKSQYTGRFDLDSVLPGSSETVGEALLTPTAIYLRAMWDITQAVPAAFGVNITGYGLKNFNRVGDGVEYHISDPMEPLPIHRVFMREGGYDVKTAWTKSNMGMGFAVIVPDEDAAKTAVSIAKAAGHDAKIVGKVQPGREGEACTWLCTKGMAGMPDETVRFKGYD